MTTFANHVSPYIGSRAVGRVGKIVGVRPLASGAGRVSVDNGDEPEDRGQRRTSRLATRGTISGVSLRAQGARLSAPLRSPLFSNAYALIANTGITAFLGFAYWVAAARLLDAATVGLAAAALSALTLLSGLAQLNLEAVMVRFVPVSGSRTFNLVRSVYGISAGTAAAAAIVFLLGVDAWTPALSFLRRDIAWALWFVVATVAWVLFVLQDGILVGFGRALWIPVENAAFGVAKLALLLVLATGGGAGAIILSSTIPIVLVVLPVSALIFWRLIPAHTRASATLNVSGPKDVRGIARYAAGDYLGRLCELASEAMLPLIVTRSAGSADNAFFYQSWTIAYTLRLIVHNMTSPLTARAARDPAHLERDGRLVFIHTLRLVAAGAAILIVGSPLILAVFGPDYAVGVPALRLLALSAIPSTIILLGLTVARVRDHIGEVIAIQAVTAVLVLGSSVVLVQSHAGTGVAAGWLGSQSLVALVLLATRLRWLVRPTITQPTAA